MKKTLSKIKNFLRRNKFLTINYIRRAWQWLIDRTWAPLMYATFNTWYNTFIYKKYCKRSWKLSQRLNGQRVFIFPKPDGQNGLHLVTSSMIADENRRRSKKRKLDIRATAQYSYGWSDKNTNAYENYKKFGKRNKRRHPQKGQKD